VDALLGLPPTGNFWVQILYISWAIQRSGLGRAAMIELERLAAGSPLKGELMVLDCIPEEFQMSDFAFESLYAPSGNPKPSVSWNFRAPLLAATNERDPD
jgi:hypothetical protein